MTARSSTRGELSRFLAIGGLTVLVDFATYRLLLALAIPVAQCKTVGFVTGTIFAYFANRHWTFAATTAHRASVPRFVTLYAVTLGINVGANALFLGLLTSFAPATTAIPVAFAGATGLSAALNFVGMKLFVFTPAARPPSRP